MGWLVSDWDHRDPDNDLEDVETGKCLDAIDQAGALTRMLLESTDFHPIIEEDDDGHYHIVKLIRKRNSEMKQGRETHFVYDNEGNKINLTEDEFDQLLGIEHNPEDIFLAEGLDLQTLDSEYTAPRDDWDVVLDETDVYRTLRRLESEDSQDERWNSLTDEEKDIEIEMLRDGDHPDFPDVKEYSSNFFPYPVDKRMVSPKAKLIAAEITNTGISRGRLARLLSEPPKHDVRPEKARALKEQASKLEPGKERAWLMKQASAMMEGYARSLKAMRLHGKSKPADAAISAADKKALWALWREQEIVRTGKCELTQWQYEKALYTKLLRSGVEHQEARARVYAAVKKLYNTDRVGRLVAYESATLTEKQRPEWLQNVQPVSKTEKEDDSWQPCDWLPSATEAIETNDEMAE